MPLTRNFFLALSRSEMLRRLAVGFPLARAMSRRFVAGETLEDAVAAVQALARQGILATLDHLGENVASEAEARDAALGVLDLLAAIEAHDLPSGVSVKLTQLGLDLSPGLAMDNLQRIVARAAQAGRFVRIDMESHEYVPATLGIFYELWQRHKNVGVVIQSYLYRSEADVARLIEAGASVRLVKGAYDEPPEVAYPQKENTDANFVRLMEMMLGDQARANRVYPAIATHDQVLIDWVKEHTRAHAIPRDEFEFQMLYGIRTDLQRQLTAEGYRMRAYVPYGEHWWPYFMRRLAERPANIFFVARNWLRR
ncbi:MAG: proline dehydrogenase family protein [Anaerolineae bacterium]|nr:proline dehydrogenase family protein [Anaerolineae bacterium]